MANMSAFICGLVLLVYCRPILSQDDCDFVIPRPPEFPDIMSSFMQTFNFDSDLLLLKEALVDDNNNPEFCNCTAALVDDWVDYNSQCDATQPECPVTTTTEEPTTTTTEEPTTTTEAPTTTTTAEPTTTTQQRTTTGKIIATIPTTKTTIRTTPRSSTTPAATKAPTTSRPKPTVTTTAPGEHISRSASTELPTTTEDTVTQSAPAETVSASGISVTVRNIIIASVCGGALALSVVVITLCVARKHSSSDSTRLKAEKLARQRSDCQPLPDNTFDSVPNTPSTRGSLSGYTNSGYQWSDSDQSKGVILNTPDGDFHYNTLKALDHPHALITGFGETSTETLPKKSKKKSSKKKKTDDNHNSRTPGSSVGKNSVGHQSTDSTPEKGSAKGSVKSKASVRSRDSGLGTKHNSGLTPAAEILSNDLMKFSVDADDLVDDKNVHLFASNSGAMLESNTSLAPSLVLPPPPEFQDLKTRDSPFNSNDRRRTETPPTAVVRPSVKELVERQESHSSSASAGSADKKPQKAEQVHISMEDMSTPEPIFIIDSNHTPEKPTQNGNANSTARSKSFLWSSPKKQSPNAVDKRPENMQKTVL